jgi:hypothetical protein
MHEKDQINIQGFRIVLFTLLTSKVPIPPYFLWASAMMRTVKHLAVGMMVSNKDQHCRSYADGPSY